MSEYLGNSDAIHLVPERYVEQSLPNSHDFFSSFLFIFYYLTVSCWTPQFLNPGCISEKNAFIVSSAIYYVRVRVLTHACRRTQTFFPLLSYCHYLWQHKRFKDCKRPSRKNSMFVLKTSSTLYIKVYRRKESILFSLQLTFWI